HRIVPAVAIPIPERPARGVVGALPPGPPAVARSMNLAFRSPGQRQSTDERTARGARVEGASFGVRSWTPVRADIPAPASGAGSRSRWEVAAAWERAATFRRAASASLCETTFPGQRRG